MNIFQKEHYDLIEMFEKDIKNTYLPNKRLDKENKTEWSKGNIYQNGELNSIFLLYRKGYMYGKTQSEEE